MSEHRQYKPPRLAERLLGWLLPEDQWQTPLGDFEEYYNEIAHEHGEGAARRWYGFQVIRLLPDRLYEKTVGGTSMLKNYLTTALRKARKQKGYVLVNLSGLAIGMACCLLLLLYVLDELSYDRHYAQAEDMYRVVLEQRSDRGTSRVAAVPTPMAATLVQLYPEVKTASRLSLITPVVGYQDHSFNETRFFLADSNFFDFFDIPLRRGDPQTALATPNGVVITEATARKYFGDADPIGNVLRVTVPRTYKVNFTEQDFVVTGIAAPMPSNTHFHFDFLASFATLQGHNEQAWMGGVVYTYVRLQEDASPSALEAHFPQLVLTYVGPYLQDRFGMSYDDFVASGRGHAFFLQPMKAIHFDATLDMEIEPSGSMTYVYLLSGIALLILLLSCANYINLTTARTFQQGLEISVRKVLGSQRGQLMRQFLTESFLLVVLALLLAAGLVAFALPGFNSLADKQLHLSDLWHGYFWIGLGGLVVFVSVLGGAYPAFFLSALRPVTGLKGYAWAGQRQSGLRNSLVVFQFVTSMILLTATLVIYHQKQYMVNKTLGFEKEQVVVIAGARLLGQQSDAFQQALARQPTIAHVSGFYTAPGQSFDAFTFQLPGTTSTEATASVKTLVAGHRFLETLGAKLVAGRSFSNEAANDTYSVIINETATTTFGWDEPLGQQLHLQDKTFTVIGLVKDFHFESLHHTIAPLAVLLPDAVTESASSFVLARVLPEELTGTLATMAGTWKTFLPEQPFTYSFLDADFEALYRAEQRASKIFGIFALLAFFIACLGLFSIAALTAEQRTKEIGIRKVLGASTSNILILIVSTFLKLISVAFIVAVPMAYVVLSRWLENFAYRTDLHAGTFALVGITALLVALLSVSYQAVKVALADPTRSLRYE